MERYALISEFPPEEPEMEYGVPGSCSYGFRQG